MTNEEMLLMVQKGMTRIRAAGHTPEVAYGPAVVSCPCTSSANTPFIPDPELFPLGDGSEEVTKPSISTPDPLYWPYPSTTTEHKKVCACGVDKIGGGVHSDWCPKKE